MWSLLCKVPHRWKTLVKTWRECWKVSVVCVHVCAHTSTFMTWCACTPQTTSSLSNSTTLMSLTTLLSTKNINPQHLESFLLAVKWDDHNAYPLVAILFSWQCASSDEWWVQIATKSELSSVSPTRLFCLLLWLCKTFRTFSYSLGSVMHLCLGRRLEVHMNMRLWGVVRCACGNIVISSFNWNSYCWHNRWASLEYMLGEWMNICGWHL